MIKKYTREEIVSKEKINYVTGKDNELNYFEVNEEGFKQIPKMVIAFAGLGGVGKTSILVETAMAIQKYSEYKPKICLLDLNLFYPSVVYKFHQDDLILCKKNIYDLLEDINVTDENLLNQALITHEPTGIKIVNNAPNILKSFDFEEKLGMKPINYEELNQLIQILKEQFDVLLIDTSSNLRNDETTGALIESDKIILLVEQDLSNILNSRKYIQMLQILEKNLSMDTKLTDRMKLVVNKTNNKKAVEKETISNALYHHPIVGTIKEDVQLTSYQNNGFSLMETNEKIREDIMNLVKMLYPIEKIESEKMIKQELNKDNWIEKYGSAHLKNCMKYGYNAQRLYITERWKKEFPDFILEFDQTCEWKNRSTPSEEALKIEIDIREKYNDTYDVRVVWMTKPPIEMKNCAGASKEQEVVIIKDYLEKYTLIKFLN